MYTWDQASGGCSMGVTIGAALTPVLVTEGAWNIVDRPAGAALDAWLFTLLTCSVPASPCATS
jgi:hypothetical protein